MDKYSIVRKGNVILLVDGEGKTVGIVHPSKVRQELRPYLTEANVGEE